MRIKTIKISGFKPFPFCATIKNELGDKNITIDWCKDVIAVNLAIEPPMQNAIIGPNSCGKSSILLAIKTFFGSNTKLTEEYFNDKNTSEPIIVEITFCGKIDVKNDWHQENCVEVEQDSFELTFVKCWTTTNRYMYIKKPDGSYEKSSVTDKQRDALLPNFRLISSEQRMDDEATLDKKDSLIKDLIDELISNSENKPKESLIYIIQSQIKELQKLIDRDNPINTNAWKEIEALEKKLSYGLFHITPGNPTVKIDYKESIPEISDIFMKGKVKISDGVELDFSEHGLGLQRSYIVSVLNAWSEQIGKKIDNIDYIFAIEDPELHLHPHVVRVFLKVFESLSQNDQIIFTSHSSEFVNRVPISNVISVRRSGNFRSVNQPDLSELDIEAKTKFQRYLQEDRSDMLFARAVLLVEGQTELFAIPAMARTIKKDLDECGVSVVFANGEANFRIYHYILEAFHIPHVILGDGDGSAEDKKKRYEKLANAVFVLEQDFEYMLVEKINDDDRILEIVNLCRERIGKKPLENLNIELTAENLKSNWWQELKEDLHSTIQSEYRDQFSEKKEQIQTLLNEIANDVINNNYYLPSNLIERKAMLIKKMGKPLAGRVVGELFREEEVRSISEIVNAIEKTIELSNN